jgi:hypothetical protein
MLGKLSPPGDRAIVDDNVLRDAGESLYNG